MSVMCILDEQQYSTGKAVEDFIVPKSFAYHYVFLCVCVMRLKLII